MTRGAGLYLLACLLLGTLLAHAQTQEVSRVHSAGGGAVTNWPATGLAVLGQGTPVGFNASASYVNHSGFLTTFTWGNPVDADSDGIDDELDPDDDNDGLNDYAELRGDLSDPTARSNPHLLDTDGDGITDPEELRTGTNPGDANSVLKMTAVHWDGAAMRVRWLAREGLQYRLLGAPDPDGVRTNASLVTTLTASGGSGPWQETQPEVVVDDTGGRAFFGVELDD